MRELNSLTDIAALRESVDIECKLAQGRDGKGALIGLGERAGSGVPKIQQGWSEQGHSLNLFDSSVPYDQTVMALTWNNRLIKTTQETT